MNFKKYADNDYEAVCDFLIELNARDGSYIDEVNMVLFL